MPWRPIVLSLFSLAGACQSASTGTPGGGPETGGAPSTTGGGGTPAGGNAGAVATGGAFDTGVGAGSGGSAGTAAASDANASTGGNDATGTTVDASMGTADASAFDARSSADAAVAADGGVNGLTGLPSRDVVLASLRLANDYFAAKWPDPTALLLGGRASNLWTRAVYYEGLMGLYGVETDMTKKTSYYDYAVRWASSPAHPWLVTGGATYDPNFQACGQTYLDLYKIDPQPVRIANTQSQLAAMVTGQVTNTWTWIDAVQMSMPAFAKLGVILADTRYFDAMWALYNDTRNLEGGGLYNAQAGLFWRDATFNPGDTYTRSPTGQDIYWSRGNGWVFAALVRVLDTIPATETHRASYVADFRAMAAALLPLQRPDGFWNESLSNPTHCQSVGKAGQDGPETSGTALFAYGFAWGIRNGLLDSGTYGPATVRAWSGLVTTALHTNGFLGWVQSTGAAPCDPADTTGLGSDVVPNFEDYGLGCFLLGGSEVYRLGR
jgi:rhamnogalacturonyl hydrolase YesR